MKLMRKDKVISLLTAAVLVWSAMLGSAIAQSNRDCLCLVPAGPDDQAVGQIVEADGQVQVSQAVGFAPGAEGTDLFRGNRIIVGPASNATILIGPTCRLRIPENNDVLLDPVDGNICVWAKDSTGGLTTAQKIGRVVVGGTIIYGWSQFEASPQR